MLFHLLGHVFGGHIGSDHHIHFRLGVRGHLRRQPVVVGLGIHAQHGIPQNQVVHFAARIESGGPVQMVLVVGFQTQPRGRFRCLALVGVVPDVVVHIVDQRRDKVLQLFFPDVAV